jgi:hypothetical protein
MGFRFNAQKVFLTYAKTPKRLTPEILLAKISQKAEVESYLISQEQHKDGTYHLHAYIKFAKKLDTKSERFFDIEYYRKTYHPNIQKPRNLHKLWRYIKKEKKFFTNIDETRPKWLVLLEDTGSYEEFLEELMWEINRIDNYAGYKTLRDLYNLRNGFDR